MVTPENAIQADGSEYVGTTTYYGLSTDEKPTEGVGNGSCFIEIDTFKGSLFDLENKRWY